MLGSSVDFLAVSFYTSTEDFVDIGMKSVYPCYDVDNVDADDRGEVDSCLKSSPSALPWSDPCGSVWS